MGFLVLFCFWYGLYADFPAFPTKSLLKCLFLECDFSVSGYFVGRVQRAEFGFTVGMGPDQRHVWSPSRWERTARGQGRSRYQLTSIMTSNGECKRTVSKIFIMITCNCRRLEDMLCDQRCHQGNKVALALMNSPRFRV